MIDSIKRGLYLETLKKFSNEYEHLYEIILNLSDKQLNRPVWNACNDELIKEDTYIKEIYELELPLHIKNLMVTDYIKKHKINISLNNHNRNISFSTFDFYITTVNLGSMTKLCIDNIIKNSNQNIAGILIKNQEGLPKTFHGVDVIPVDLKEREYGLVRLNDLHEEHALLMANNIKNFPCCVIDSDCIVKENIDDFVANTDNLMASVSETFFIKFPDERSPWLWNISFPKDDIDISKHVDHLGKRFVRKKRFLELLDNPSFFYSYYNFNKYLPEMKQLSFKNDSDAFLIKRLQLTNNLFSVVEQCKQYEVIVVTGPQRSGTTIKARVLSKELDYTYIDEEEFSSGDLEQFKNIVLGNKNCVIHAPAMTSICDELDNKRVFVVYSKRKIIDVVNSQKRINWKGEKFERRRYKNKFKEYKTIEHKKISEIKTHIWETHQKQKCNTSDLWYDDIKYHPLFENNRDNFDTRQWKKTSSIKFDEFEKIIPLGGNCASTMFLYDFGMKEKNVKSPFSLSACSLKTVKMLIENKFETLLDEYEVIAKEKNLNHVADYKNKIRYLHEFDNKKDFKQVINNIKKSGQRLLNDVFLKPVKKLFIHNIVLIKGQDELDFKSFDDSEVLSEDIISLYELLKEQNKGEVELLVVVSNGEDVNFNIDHENIHIRYIKAFSHMREDKEWEAFFNKPYKKYKIKRV